MNLYDAAEAGDLKRVQVLVEQGVDMEEKDEEDGWTPLDVASRYGHLDVVRYLVGQGANKENVSGFGAWTALMTASLGGHLEVTRYLLEQGANRDKASTTGDTSLHIAVRNGHLETAKLLMAYGADLNAKDNDGMLPIDMTYTEEIRRAIREEPRRRMDHGHKRATEQDRHPNAAASVSAQQEEAVEVGMNQSNKRPRLDEETEAEEGKVAEEDEDSEPSDEEEDV